MSVASSSPLASRVSPFWAARRSRRGVSSPLAYRARPLSSAKVRRLFPPLTVGLELPPVLVRVLPFARGANLSNELQEGRERTGERQPLGAALGDAGKEEARSIAPANPDQNQNQNTDGRAARLQRLEKKKSVMGF